MDIGTSAYMSSGSGSFSSTSPLASHIIVGNGSTLPITHFGSSSIPTPSSPLLLHNILIAPTLIKNLIFVRSFTRGISVSLEFGHFGFSVKDLRTKAEILRDSHDDLCPLSPNKTTAPAHSFLATTIPVDVWHQRLGHPSCEALSRTLRSFDDFSHYLWTFPLCCKSNVFATIKHFCAYVRTQFHLPLQSVQANNGCEFGNHASCSFFATHGITLHLSCLYTSQQNGKSERMIRTVNDIIRTLLFHAYMSPPFWAEALATATYLLNRRPCKPLNLVSPYERLFGVPPDYSHLRVFGCLCYL